MSRALLSCVALLALAACQNTKTAASIDPAQQAAIHVPNVTFTPDVWETAGSELMPTLKITTPPHNERVTYRFEYEGDGSVELPNPITLEPGQNQLNITSPFRTQGVSETAQGIVRVVWTHPIVGEKTVGSWTVVQRPSILQEMRVARADSLVDNESWDCTYAITVEMDPVEEWVDQSIAVHRDVFFEAACNAGETGPVIQVFANVNIDDYASFPRELVPEGPYKAYVVCVKRPRIPSRKRPFLQVRARTGGDEVERFLKLPF